MAQERLEDAISDELKRRYPSFGIVYKDESWLHRLLGWLMFWLWRRREDGTWYNLYVDRYVSVLRYKVCIPHRGWAQNRPRWWRLLAHEGQHMWDRKRYKILFDVGYLLPQALVPLGLLGFWFPWCWWFFLAALPWPAPLRAWAELRGYAMDMAGDWWVEGEIRDETVDWVVGQFTSPVYYWMWPFRRQVRRWVLREKGRIEEGEYEHRPWSRTVYDCIRHLR